MDDLRLIERFTEAASPEADEAFAAMSVRTRKFIMRYLGTIVPRAVEREDVASIALAKLWLHRREFEVRGVGAWWAYVARVARRCAYDHLGKAEFAESLEEVSEADEVEIGAVADLTQLRSQLYKLADEVWLEAAADLSLEERKRRVLAAQLFHLHKVAWPEVCRIVGIAGPNAREQLDAWLQERSTLLELCHSELYFDNESLTALLLGLEEKPTALDQLLEAARNQAEIPPAGWTWNEVKVVIRRFRNGLSVEKIQQMDPSISADEIESAMTKCLRAFPFRAAAEGICASKALRKLVSEPGLWKRLVFQYHAADELPQKQILERTQPASEVAGYKLTSGMLNVWLSNGRLAAQLAAQAQRGTI